MLKKCYECYFYAIDRVLNLEYFTVEIEEEKSRM